MSLSIDRPTVNGTFRPVWLRRYLNYRNGQRRIPLRPFIPPHIPVFLPEIPC